MKINVLIAFPIGAHIHSNIEEQIYRQLMKMIHRLSCICLNEKCVSCSLKSSCHYFHLTGENFNAYPGVLMKRNLFSKQIFRENEEYLLTFFMIGNCRVYQDYIHIFFKEYLDYQLCGYPFLIKEISNEVLENQYVHLKTCQITSTIEDGHFQQIYNRMINYYNHYYQCQYQCLDKTSIWLYQKKSKMKMVYLKTNKIFPYGITGIVQLNGSISSDALQIGVGIYNYLGGGHIEN